MIRIKFILLVVILVFISPGTGFGQDNQSFQTADACLKLFPKVEDGYTMRKRMIASAKEEIMMSYYSFTDDDKPYYILAMLKDAVEKGVKVRMILDAMNSKLNESVLQYLEESGVEIKTFNPVTLRRIFRVDRRMHDKYIIVDRKYILVGGRNIDPKYFEGNLEKKGSFFDIDGFFEGAPAKEAAEYFEQRWQSRWIEKPRHRYRRFDPELYKEIGVRIIEQTKILRSDSTAKPVSGYLKRPCIQAVFVANDRAPKNATDRLKKSILMK